MLARKRGRKGEVSEMVNEAGREDVVQMSEEDAARISARVDEAAARIAEAVKGVRTSGRMQFQGNVIEMLAVLVVLRYLDNEAGEKSITNIELCNDGSLRAEAQADEVGQWLLS